MPAVGSRSLIEYGMPSRGPLRLAAREARLGRARQLARVVGRDRQEGVQLRVQPLDPGERRVRDLHGRERLRAVEPAELEGGRVGQVGRVHPGLLVVVDEARAEAPSGAPPDEIQGRTGRGRLSRGCRAGRRGGGSERPRAGRRPCDDRRRGHPAPNGGRAHARSEDPGALPARSPPRVRRRRRPAAWARTPTWRPSWRATWSARTWPATTPTASSASRSTSATPTRGLVVPSARPVIRSGRRRWPRLVDARRGFGQHSTMFALEWAMARARQHGVAMVAVRHSTHIGRLGEYAERTAAEGLIGIVTVGAVGAGIGGVVPFGGRTRFLGTNPWALSVPGRTAPLHLRRRDVDGRRGQGPRRAGGREAAAARRDRGPGRASHTGRRGLLRGRRAPAARRRRWPGTRATGSGSPPRCSARSG